MLLEFLPEGSPCCPLIRLFEFSPHVATRLHAVVIDLAQGRREQVLIHQLPGVVPIGGCELAFGIRAWDQAVIQTGPFAFHYRLTVATWDNVAGLIEPFMTDRNGYQWLAQGGEAALLLSVSGQW